jgi:hypothetical protein
MLGRCKRFMRAGTASGLLVSVVLCLLGDIQDAWSQQPLSPELLKEFEKILSGGRRGPRPIIRGDVVKPADQRRLGLVTIGGGGCSGVLLNNQWALTAGHCFRAGVTRATVVSFGGGASINSSHVYSFGGDALSGGARDLRGADLALVHLSTPVSINGSTTGFQNFLYQNGSSALANSPVLVFGFGSNALNPSAGGGVWRLGVMRINTPATTPVNAITNAIAAFPVGPNGTVCAWGDSGGPFFVFNAASNRSEVAATVVNGNLVCGSLPPAQCTQANTTQITSCFGSDVADLHFAIERIAAAPLWNLAKSAQVFDVSGDEWDGMGYREPGLLDVNVQGWETSQRAAGQMCFNRGFNSGHFNGFENPRLGSLYGLACTGPGATFVKIPAFPTNLPQPPLGFLPPDWAAAARVAHAACQRLTPNVSGQFTGTWDPQGLLGVFCYSGDVKLFTATRTQIAQTGSPVPDVDAVGWAQAARAAHRFCGTQHYTTGFMTGNQGTDTVEVLCQELLVP